MIAKFIPSFALTVKVLLIVVLTDMLGITAGVRGLFSRFGL